MQSATDGTISGCSSQKIQPWKYLAQVLNCQDFWIISRHIKGVVLSTYFNQAIWGPEKYHLSHFLFTAPTDPDHALAPLPQP